MILEEKMMSGGLSTSFETAPVPRRDLSRRSVITSLSHGAEEAIQLSRNTFGHTFTTHGEEMTEFLINRAKGSGKATGQFLDNQAAAKFISDNLHKVKNGAVSLPIPENFPARMINPNGTFGIPTSIRSVPGGKGVKTAYPEF